MNNSTRVLAVFLATFLAGGGLVGCNRQAADPSVESAGGSRAADGAGRSGPGPVARQELPEQPSPAGLTRQTPPDQIVAAFLDALRKGDSGVAEALLTRRAHDETRKRDLTLQELGSPQARFEVGVPKYLGTNKNGAHVNTAWTEEKDGAVISYDVVWALRREDSGWRVAGMGAQLEPGQPLVYLNFEDPDDMLAKWHAANDAVVGGESPDAGIRQARNVEPPDAFQR